MSIPPVSIPRLKMGFRMACACFFEAELPKTEEKIRLQVIRLKLPTRSY
jgi:hypothetical protein